MPVDSTHPDYDASLDWWQRCRDAVAGSDAIKAAGETYLPKLGGQDQKRYDSYKLRAVWYNATSRTLQAMLGCQFRKPPTVAWPDALTLHLKDITLTGLSLPLFAYLLEREVWTTGRYGVLVDYPDPTTAAPGSRPKWIGYPAERIRNWQTRRVGEATVLSLVVLADDREDLDPADPFVPVITPQLRVLRLDEADLYVVDLYRQVTATDASGQARTTWQLAETFEPTIRGARIAYIPYRFFAPSGAEPTPEKPPLLDLVDLNLAHYRNAADLEHGRHYCGLPTPWVAGFNIDEDQELVIGSQAAWVATDPAAHAGMLEFTGQGLGALEHALQEKEAKMAAIGARLIEEPKKDAETAETLRLRQSGEQSIVQTAGQVTGEGLTVCAAWHLAWLGVDPEAASIALNADFAAIPLSAPELTALWQVYQSGGMSWETFYYQLQKGEIARPDITAEQERHLIDTQGPARPPRPEPEPDDEKATA
jgi:hypothetical protein